MPRHRSSSRPCGHVLHTRPHLHLVVSDPSVAGMKGGGVPRFDQVRSSQGDIGPAPVMYLSPFDAWLDATLASRAGTRYTVCAAREYDPRESILTHGGRLLVSVHCAWAACDGRLLASHVSLTGLRHVQVLDVPRDRMSAIDLVMDGSKFGMGVRSQRYSMIVDDGVVKELNGEQSGEFRVSAADYLLAQL